jgi:uncharacterized protein YigA (DUF484 family)
MRAEDVAKYLAEHPEFFDNYSELLASVHVPHPYGGHAIPLSERQVLTLRERSRALEGKLRELVQFGEENDTISDQVHRISAALLRARDLDALLDTIQRNLREDFNVPGAAMRIWAAPGRRLRPEFDPVGEETRVFAESLRDPYFCAAPMFDTAAWLAPDADELASLVYVPLRGDAGPLGILALGSPDARRFTPDMGTLYLVRLGELLSAALQRHLEA